MDLPPLTALRAFEAAARRLSFKDAAAELHVTPAALSLQIRNLEEHLGQPLFRRLNRAVELTEAGRALTGPATDGFETLRAGWRAARRLNETGALTVTAGPAFTAKWLAPRLFAFARDHPEIELRFVASLRLMDFARDEIDVAIRFGAGDDAGLWSLPLAREWVAPAMTPDLAAGLRTPADLARLPLIHDASIDFLRERADWPAWFRAAGLGAAPAPAATFSQADHSVDAALAGVGAVLGRRSLIVKDVAEGRLVLPFALALDTGARFRFVCAEGTEDRPAIAALRDWILAEIERNEAITGTLDIRPPA
ncbi:MAG: transcriptional regulator GcvA [Hasllibacter sp.]